jgi:putative N6-adenine-specific DNA methylase
VSWTAANAARAEAPVDVARADAASLELPPGPGLIIANPPYGKRLAAGSHLAAYRALGELHRRAGAGWRLAALVARGDVRARGHLLTTGRQVATHPVDNGGLRLELIVVGV